MPYTSNLIGDAQDENQLARKKEVDDLISKYSQKHIEPAPPDPIAVAAAAIAASTSSAVTRRSSAAAIDRSSLYRLPSSDLPQHHHQGQPRSSAAVADILGSSATSMTTPSVPRRLASSKSSSNLSFLHQPPPPPQPQQQPLMHSNTTSLAGSILPTFTSTSSATLSPSRQQKTMSLHGTPSGSYGSISILPTPTPVSIPPPQHPQLQPQPQIPSRRTSASGLLPSASMTAIDFYSSLSNQNAASMIPGSAQRMPDLPQIPAWDPNRSMWPPPPPGPQQSYAQVIGYTVVSL